MALLSALLCALTTQADPDIAKGFQHYRPVSEAPFAKVGATALSKVYRGPAADLVSLDNGLVRAVISLKHAGTFEEFSRRGTDSRMTAADLSLPIFVLNGSPWSLVPTKISTDAISPTAPEPKPLRVLSARASMLEKPFEWRPSPGKSGVWPPRGMGVKFTYIHPEITGLLVELFYWLPDNSPSVLRKVLLRNASAPTRIQGRDWEWFQIDDPTLQLNQVIGPGTVYELPDQWATLPLDGKDLDRAVRVTLAQVAPFKTSEPKMQSIENLAEANLESAILEAKSKKLEGVLFTGFDPSSSTDESRADLQRFVAKVSDSKLIPGIEISMTRGFPSKDLVKGAGLCLTSDSGRAVSGNLPLAMAQLGLKYVRFTERPSMDCSDLSHPHGFGGLARYENQKAWRGLFANLLGLGIHVSAPHYTPFGPDLSPSISSFTRN
ncbi:hypothetical protein QPK87_10685 [Kamptonema cortianum]|nr:hypothetical protein [Geitlerinema splendidum]MDK3157040.1 hypothetical protein [Kamptonema cortianum]